MSTIEITRVEDVREGDLVKLRWEYVDGATVTLEGPMRNQAVGGYTITDARFVSATREMPEHEPDDAEALRQDLARCKEVARVHARDAQACRAEAEQLRPEVAKYRKEAERLRRLLSMAREENRTSRDAWWAEARKLESEVERLRGSMDANTNVLISSNGTIWHHDTHCPHRRTMPTRKQIVDAMWPDAPEGARVGLMDLDMIDRVLALIEQGGAS